MLTPCPDRDTRCHRSEPCPPASACRPRLHRGKLRRAASPWPNSPCSAASACTASSPSSAARWAFRPTNTSAASGSTDARQALLRQGLPLAASSALDTGFCRPEPPLPPLQAPMRRHPRPLRRRASPSTEGSPHHEPHRISPHRSDFTNAPHRLHTPSPSIATAPSSIGKSGIYTALQPLLLQGRQRHAIPRTPCSNSSPRHESDAGRTKTPTACSTRTSWHSRAPPPRQTRFGLPTMPMKMPISASAPPSPTGPPFAD